MWARRFRVQALRARRRLTASAPAVAPPPAGSRWVRWAVGGALVGLPTLKLVWACAPLFVGSDEAAAAAAAAQERATHASEAASATTTATATASSAGPIATAAPPSSLSLASLVHHGSDRLLRDVATAALVVADYWRADPSPDADWTEVHERAAHRLLRLCRVNRGVYIKFAQHVAQLEHLLPAPYVRVMSAMLHEAPTDAPAVVRATVEAELGAPVEAVFSSFDFTPIASASLAQVHVATLRRDGARVAVKVQHPHLRAMAAVDIATIEVLVALVRRLFPRFEYGWLVEEMKQNLPRELTFTLEARNMERCAALLAAEHPRVVVPTVVHAATTPSVLTMSFESGVHVHDAAAVAALGVRPGEVAAALSAAFCAQIFLHGFVHCDPHAGNVLVRRARDGGAEVVLLDHGLYRELGPAFRLDYCALWRALVLGDADGIRAGCERLGAGDGLYKVLAAMLTTQSWEALTDPARRPLAGPSDGPAADTRRLTARFAARHSDDIQAVLARVPRELLLLLKTADCLRAVDAQLGAPTTSLATTARFAVRGLGAHALATSPGLATRVRVALDAARVEALALGLWLWQWWRGGE
jgi:aarF domain-containing kinase